MDLEEELLSPLRGATPPVSGSVPPVDPLFVAATMTANPSDTDSSGDGTNPTVPKLVGIVGTIKWIGGPPNADFTALAYTGPSTPLCFRNLDTSSEIKGYVKRTEGLSTKFKRDDPGTVYLPHQIHKAPGASPCHQDD